MKFLCFNLKNILKLRMKEMDYKILKGCIFSLIIVNFVKDDSLAFLFVEILNYINLN